MSSTNKTQLGLALFALLCCIILAFVVLYASIKTPTSPPIHHPTLSFDIAKEGDDYIFTVSERYDPDRVLELDRVDVGLVGGNITYSSFVTVQSILNNESSNITFYDEDNDNLLSKDDVFKIDGESISQVEYFVGVSKYGTTVFKETMT